MKRGGKREGSGRRKIYHEPLKSIRVPESLAPKVKKMLREYRESVLKNAANNVTK